MTAPDPHCDFCDLPMAQCAHGQPMAAAAPPVVASSPKPRKRVPATPRKRVTAQPSSRVAAVKTVSRRWTAPEALKPFILAVLEGADGDLEADELFLELELVLEDRLLPGDRETTPSGEPRWQYAARRARVELIDEGLMTRGVPGVWRLAKAP